MANTAFEHTDHRHIGALHLDFHSYIHRATGARHFHFACDDTNNAFMVAFPTMPTDSTGVAHMLEHTTLCGSRRYSVRDPFFMMLRRSLNTFMNAFTSGDSTAYPFATQNRKDFSNLLAVYLDAVFFPNLDPLDFAQEGWRLDFATLDGDSELVFKGVVYNEMKGAMSAPSSKLWQRLHSTVLPDTVYQFNSGGEPANIPDLTFEQLQAFHVKHYHPSHAIFMTYGSFSVDEHQAQFESLALSEFTRCPEQISCPLQPRFKTPVTVEECYGVADASEVQRSTHAVWGWLLGQSADVNTLLEAHLLAAILLDHGASPLRHFLETTDLADAPSELCGLDDSSQELVLCCGVEGTDPEHVDQLNSEILQLLQNLQSEVVEHETLVGIVDRMEMAQRDLGGGGYPYGLQLMGRALPGSLYGKDPAALIDVDDALESLRLRVEDPNCVGVLVGDLLVNNPHRVSVVMRPDEHKLKRDNDLERERLADLLREKDQAERSMIRAASAALEARQDEPQNASILPKVTLADVPRSLPEIAATTAAISNSVAHQYRAATNGLLYLHLVFELPALDDLELVQLPLFCEYLTELGAGSEDYLGTQSRRALVGNINAYAAATTSVDRIDAVDGRLVVTVKGLGRKRDDLIGNLFEVVNAVRFDETERLQDLTTQSRVDAEASITDRGHQLAMQGAARSLSAGGYLDDLWEGPANVAFVQDLDRSCRDSTNAAEALGQAFERVRNKLLCAPWRVLVVGEDQIVGSVVEELQTVAVVGDSDGEFRPFQMPQPLAQPDCAWVTNTQVNFCAKAFPAVTEGHDDAAGLSVLAKFLQDGYLHPAIREKGGAYGAGAQFDPESATFRFFSYRDPRLTDTLVDFDRSLDWLDTSNDPQRLEESILGVIRNLDNPRTPAGAAIQSFYDNLDGRNREFRLRFRDSILNTSFDDIASVARKYLDQRNGTIAVVTNASYEVEIKQLHLNEVKL